MAEKWNNQALVRLLWPLVIEQILGVTMGIADTVMVAAIGEYAVSGVSLVDAINTLLIIAFGALATGGAVVVSHYIGRQDMQTAGRASKQLMYANTAAAVIIMGLALAGRRPLLQGLYGQIAPDVMEAAETYFLFSALSYPFLAIYNAAASLFRSMGNSRVTMRVALLVNLLNVAGNGLFIYGFHLGVTGAAIATLVSRMAAAAVLTCMLITDRRLPFSLRGIRRITLEPVLLRSILRVGIPSGLESSLFQIGKILVSRIFTSFGTAAIAANAVSGVINSFSFMPANAFALGILTVVGQCVGAADYGSARNNTAKLMKLTYGSVFFLSLLILVFMDPLLGIFKLSPEAHELARGFLYIHCIMAPISWPASFTLPNALRAAGDVRYCMAAAVLSMWLIRVSAAYILAYPLGLGARGVWYAMVSDWCVRGICYIRRWKQGRWEDKQILAG
ncbi:MAG: MATE family efflux transporter [Treponema sp.]|jgi:putative MATE family efflux protein|nr:MATE family efflux transporter [Treponema sp.]